MSAVLPTRMVERPWGRDSLPDPFFAPPGQRIGEVWFEPPPQLPELLVKYIFTSEALSVQVHPSDQQARDAGADSRGKDECWLITSAEPGAKLALGFKQPVAAEAMRAAALDGTIQDLLAWHIVQPGDFFYIPAGTVHAIGAGIGLIEVQQNSDITYRLYDYGRPRPLHLDAGIRVAKGEPFDPALHRHVPPAGTVRLVEGPIFRLDRIDTAAGKPVTDPARAGAVLVIPINGAATIGGEVILPGDCAVAPAIAAVSFGQGRFLIAQPCN